MRSLLTTLRDARDERRSRRLRDELGRRRWLASWYRRDDGSWLARLSCPDHPRTVERTGRTRSEAILAAERALARYATAPR